MPTIQQTPVRAYAHCRDARCSGYAQEQVDAVREEASYTFGENGGDGVFTNMIESSRVEFKFADPRDSPCPACGQDREVTGDPRPQYVNESGYDPMGLLSVPKFDAEATYVPPAETEEDVEARIRAKLREEQIEARLRAEME